MNKKVKLTRKELSFHQQFKSFRKIERDVIRDDKGNPIPVFYAVDKNGQICDCTRISNVFDKVHGVPATLVNPFKKMEEAYGE